MKIIASPATAPGVAGVSMIRISGGGCIDLVQRCFTGRLKKKESHSIAYGRFFDPMDGRQIDEIMIGVFHHGRSFTGEESLELWTHGSPYIVKETMRVLLDCGASMAEPGEFTMRAFLNGRIDLSQAEAVLVCVCVCERERVSLTLAVRFLTRTPTSVTLKLG